MKQPMPFSPASSSWVHLVVVVVIVICQYHDASALEQSHLRRSPWSRRYRQEQQQSSPMNVPSHQLASLHPLQGDGLFPRRQRSSVFPLQATPGRGRTSSRQQVPHPQQQQTPSAHAWSPSSSAMNSTAVVMDDFFAPYPDLGTTESWPTAGTTARRSISKTLSRIVFPSSLTQAQQNERVAVSMAFLTAWANIAIFSKFRTFATMMTGNWMWLIQAFVDGQLGNVAYYGTVILSYLAGVVAFRKWTRDQEVLQQRHAVPIQPSSSMPATWIAMAFFLADLCSGRWNPMLLLAFGFGLINSMGQNKGGTMTFVVTGHMTKLANQICDYGGWLLLPNKKEVEQPRVFAGLQNVSLIYGFGLGALLGCLMRKFQWLATGQFTVLGVLYSLLFLWHDRMSSSLPEGAW